MAAWEVQVEFDEVATKAEALVEAVEDCGFDASLVSVQNGKQKGQDANVSSDIVSVHVRIAT